LPAFAYEQQLRVLSSQMAESLAKAERKTVAVADFTDLQGNVTELGRFLAEELSIALVKDRRGFDVIDRIHLKAIIQEHKLNVTGLIDPKTARQLGSVAGVDALVTGNITPFGDSVRLSVHAIDSATAKNFGAETADIPKTDAIRGLLATGIGSNAATVAASAASTPAVTGGDSTQAPKMGAQAQDIAILLRACRRAGDKVVCSGTLTNKGPKTLPFGISNHSYMVDNVGKQSEKTVAEIGSKSSAGVMAVLQELEPDVPMTFSIASYGLDPNASTVSVIVKCYGQADETVTFRGIPISH
jgi:TolB-like protein